MLTIQEIITQHISFFTSREPDPYLEFEFLHSLDSQGIKYDEQALLLLYLNLDVRDFLWRWYEDSFFRNISDLVFMITGPISELPIAVLDLFYDYCMNTDVYIDNLQSFVLAGIAGIYIPYLNSTDRNLTEPIQEIINITDTEDLNRFIGASSQYSYEEYIDEGFVRGGKADIGFLNMYIFDRVLSRTLNISLLQGERTGTYREWVELIMRKAKKLYNQIQPYLSFHREYWEYNYIIPPILIAYLDNLVQEPDEEVIDEAISCLQRGIQSILERIHLILSLEGIDISSLDPDIFSFEVRNFFHIPDKGIISELYNILERRGFNIGREHITDIFNVINVNFPQFGNPGNLEMIRGVYGADNGPLALFLISNGILDEDSPAPWRNSFQKVFSNPYTSLDDNDSLFRLGFLGMIITFLERHISDFYDGLDNNAVGQLIYTIEWLAYDYFFTQDHDWGRVFVEVMSDAVDHFEILYNLTGKHLPGYLVARHSPVIYKMIIVDLSKLILDYFRNRSTLSFTGLRFFDGIPLQDLDADLLVERIVNTFKDLLDKEMRLLKNLIPKWPVNIFNLLYLSALAEEEVVELFTDKFPSQYGDLIRRLVRFIADIDGLSPSNLSRFEKLREKAWDSMESECSMESKSSMESESSNLKKVIIIIISVIIIFIVSIIPIILYIYYYF